jgi:isopenicillin-N epimerase
MTLSAAPHVDLSLSPEVLRQQFMLDDNVVFLNHGSFGACPNRSGKTIRRGRRQLERQPVEFFSRHTPLLASAVRHWRPT